MKKNERLQEEIKALASGPLNMEELLEKFKISERTVWRDKQELEKMGYNIKVTGNRWELVQSKCLEQVKAAKFADVRRIAILKLVASGCNEEAVIKRMITDRFGCSEGTVTKDIADLIKLKFLAKEKGNITLGDAMLPELDLNVEEGSRLLSYLILRQEIEGKNPLYNTLVYSLISALGKYRWYSWEQAKRTKQKIFIKGKNAKHQLRELMMAERLEQASWEEQVVELVYRDKKRQVEPLGVIYSYHQDAWYLHAFCRKAQERRTFRLENIQEFRVLEDKFIYPQDFDLRKTYLSAWGIMLNEPVQYVRIKFYDEFNVLSRLKREIAEREQAKLTPLEDGSVLYEDWATGMEEFKVWVRSFGSSAEIIEPQELREKLIESVKQALARYGEVR